ncbi:enolase-phosphatase E1 [Lingula anatina]|uniref:Enolase-phosphatase E1 n=1 Tax=Lingula anatina TaxID=7574 RepID=A0A1S3IEQ6_LINAN|nr:enolase-phosphatase E1 [Lingula anatina]|eukprot:XP_013395944.1 enolase-phosphatase E1 [Lingula anatina]
MIMKQTMRITYFCFLLLLVGVRAQGGGAACPNLGGVVAGCIIGTAVLCAVIAVVVFLLWRRRLHSDGGKSKVGEDHAYENAAYQNDESVLEKKGDVEEALPVGYVMCAEYTSPNKNKPKAAPIFSLKREQSQPKSWSSLPRNPFTSLDESYRKGSRASLDDNIFNGETEVVSVSLQSKDIIGLGFNVAGSMRDGIFISQVHNRGPASESGKIKVGDRIVSVTISFENMVYEDALTILSYASPYPVQVQLQKSKPTKSGALQVRRTPSQSSLPNLHHPLYRSQSLDDLSRIMKDSQPLKTRRAFSENRKANQALKQGSLKSGREMTWETNMNRPVLELDEDSKWENVREPNIFGDEQVIDLTDGKSEIFKEKHKFVEHDKTEVQATIEMTELQKESAYNLEAVHPVDNKVDAGDKSFEEVDIDSPESTQEELTSPYSQLTEQDRNELIRLSYEDSAPPVVENSSYHQQPEVTPDEDQPVVKSQLVVRLSSPKKQDDSGVKERKSSTSSSSSSEKEEEREEDSESKREDGAGGESSNEEEEEQSESSDAPPAKLSRYADIYNLAEIDDMDKTEMILHEEASSMTTESQQGSISSAEPSRSQSITDIEAEVQAEMQTPIPLDEEDANTDDPAPGTIEEDCKENIEATIPDKDSVHNCSIKLMSDEEKVQAFLTNENPDPKLLFNESLVNDSPPNDHHSQSSDSDNTPTPETAQEFNYEINGEESEEHSDQSGRSSPKFLIDEDEVIHAVPAQAILDESEEEAADSAVSEGAFVIDVSEQDFTDNNTGLTVPETAFTIDQSTSDQQDTSSSSSSSSEDEGTCSPNTSQFTIVLNGDEQSSSYGTSPEASPTKPSFIIDNDTQTQEQLMNMRNNEENPFGNNITMVATQQYSPDAFTITLNTDE